MTLAGRYNGNDMQQETKAKISNPERVARIVQRIVEARMYGLIRTKRNATLAIKTRFNALKTVSGKTFINLDGISEKGMKAFDFGGIIQIEVLGMSTKLMFLSRVAQVVQNGVLIPLPESLVSVERRSNTRYMTTLGHGAFIKLGIWTPEARDVTAPLVFEEYADLAGWCSLSDLSLGGASVLTRFPAVLSCLAPEQIDGGAELILPGQAALKLRMEVRWMKRTKERIKVNGVEQYQQKFRFGVRFLELTDYAEISIKQFLKQLSMAEAI